MAKIVLSWLTVIAVLLSNMSLETNATVYQVGGLTSLINWRPSGGDYQAWADKINFFVGDVIVFRFSPRFSNVANVTKEQYDSCPNVVNGAYTRRNSPLPLTLIAPGKFYIISTASQPVQNCDQQRFSLTVSSLDSINSPPPSSPSSPLAPTQSPSAASPTPNVDSKVRPSASPDPNSSPSSESSPSPDSTSDSNSSKDGPNSSNSSKKGSKSKSSSRRNKIIGGVVGGTVGITITIGITIKLYFVFKKRSNKKKRQDGASAAAGKRSRPKRGKTTNADSNTTGDDQK